MLEFLEVSATTLLVIAFAAFLTGALHGATGMAGGVTMTAVLAHIVGIKVAVPVMTCALVFSHASRIGLYWRDTDWAVSKRVLLFGLPMTAVGALLFTVLDPRMVALIFAGVLALSFPIKYWARAKGIKTGPKLLAGASCIWGLLAGNVTGPGFFLTPFLLGTGMNRLAFVGTMATVALSMNLVKLAVFGSTEFMDARLFTLGVIIGLISIPANWAGKAVLKQMSDRHHSLIIDGLTLLMIVNFIYLAAM
jgi:uncharacterized membrane protein YfcA